LSKPTVARSLLGDVLVDGLGRGFRTQPGKLPLAGCHAKLERASEHLQQLDAELGLFFDSDPYGAIGELEPNSDWYVFRVKTLRPPPPRIGVLIGDLVHQLRSTLDHMVFEAATKHLGRKPPENISLPIETSPAQFEKKAPRKLMDLRRNEWVVSDQCLALITGMQPYQGTDRPHEDHLAILERLWNLDKHQTVIPLPIAQQAGWSADFIPNADAEPILERRGRGHIALEDDAKLISVRISRTGPNPHVHMDGDALVKVQGKGFMRNLTADLWWIQSTVAMLVAAFSTPEPPLSGGVPPSGMYRTRIVSV
jgi:hypothetical protein